MQRKNKELQKAGLKATLPRIKILEVLDAKGHLSAEDIYKELILMDEDVGLATIYRVLTQFEAAGIVIKHNFEEAHAVYEIVSDEHHDHMVCIESGKIIEFHDEVIEQRQAEIASQHGYEIVDHNMVLYVKKIKS
ncbi:ferric iron uptake transcriptional regulator [Gammaproteobacteria bacterium]|jgi:Fur family ferric uptake transcriptional regulator|nr:ferric iron uptake transcriptional regulator [Gammaproteobacteria bacterium]MDA8982184.1 ferric iron uptake transcriptional regulator [Gammaproteobacteria bacterium]MDA9142964.1 ferric iron uptake transcriptional regulator [Gammaproteobacteria bacterium]MDA9997775.1 ferric iron uptake transcriptional regulator [Gammaproteobacteria bacterium]MDC1123607.1 ferric iron uptake transcriptional regulator [Gammaproteobacteria bacterium]